MPSYFEQKSLLGGLSLRSPRQIKDNQFSVLKNFRYDKEGRLISRNGYTPFGNSVGTSPPTSYFFFQRDDTGARIALMVAGTIMYRYNEGTSSWVSIKTGLTEFEPSAPTKRTRWSFAVYKNIVYMCNGVNSYASWDGTTYTEYPAQPKVRYLQYSSDRMFGAGDDTNPSTLYYTGSLAINANTLNANVLVVGGDEMGRINMIRELGQVLIVGKSKKNYAINVAGPSALPLDVSNGAYAHRAAAAVGNGVVHFNDQGVQVLQARQWVAGAAALVGEPLSADLARYTDQILPSSYNSTIGYHAFALRNYYSMIDRTADDIPDTTMVYSSYVGAWTEYTLPNAYDLGFYIDDSGNYHYLFASSAGGQMYEFETGFTDNGLDIECELRSKSFDFGAPGQQKTIGFIDLIGYKTIGSIIDCTTEIDGEQVYSGQITDDNITSTTSSISIGSAPIGLYPIWGPAAMPFDTLDLFPCIIRMPLYQTGEVVSYSMTGPAFWTLEKTRMEINQQQVDFFPFSYIG